MTYNRRSTQNAGADKGDAQNGGGRSLDVRLAVIRATFGAPWKGTHDGRWWTLEADDVESVVRAVVRGGKARVLLALLNVARESHPKAIKPPEWT